MRLEDMRRGENVEDRRDDTLQRRTQGRVVPETFTHGTADQRQRWFQRGFHSGRIENCDTNSAGSQL